MEFKGTKDKYAWSYEHDGDGMRFNGISVYVDDCYENYREDAQLISKAPEMLQMLIEISKTAERVWETNHENEFFDEIDFAELDDLIKEATEL